MIALSDITNRYHKPLPKSIRLQISKWIAEAEPQKYIEKALGYELTDQDYRHLFKVGNQKAKYPRLYYLCCIYIHPLTIAQHIVTKYLA